MTDFIHIFRTLEPKPDSRGEEAGIDIKGVFGRAAGI